VNIVITGSHGFVAKNLIWRLKDKSGTNIYKITKSSSENLLKKYLADADIIFHLAGENRPKNVSDFKKNNFEFTKKICRYLTKPQKQKLIIFSSSSQSGLDNPYGKSKQKAEKVIKEWSQNRKCSAVIYRLDNIFGKWCRPNYNSVVATFCFNALNSKPLEVHEPAKKINLIYIDDVIESFMRSLNNKSEGTCYKAIKPQYKVSLSALRNKIYAFAEADKNNQVLNYGSGFTRKLYATYLSHKSPRNFSYKLKKNIDERGEFTEIIKNKNTGQFSFFTAKPGVTRGGHYHHTKNEKFLVLQGSATFRFKNLYNNKTKTINVESDDRTIVETIPGWAHDITNTSSSDLIVFLWSNEIFDPNHPDTYFFPFEQVIK
jgi:UDP-2-acetamido-2,6-beta-L-arabino-hexul-4-ose reductase